MATHLALPPVQSDRVPSYQTALRILHDEAYALIDAWENEKEIVPLQNSAGLASKYRIATTKSTPEHDTSAMDGYALCSLLTKYASVDCPMKFCVRGSIGAGYRPRKIPENGHVHEGATCSLDPCIKIATGARFPDSAYPMPFDCCIKAEDSRYMTHSDCPDGYPHVFIMKAAHRNMNKRLAGTDFQRGEEIIEAGDVIQLNHIMALASMGFTKIAIRKVPRIGVFSTGDELLSPTEKRPDAQHISDTNGPFLVSSLRELGVRAEFLGVIDDDHKSQVNALAGKLEEFDIIITSGAASSGPWDHIPQALASLNANVLFHRVAIRPGHPALFATIPHKRLFRANSTSAGDGSQGETIFFGLPGNPIAAAACFQFLVEPFINTLISKPCESPIRATVVGSDHILGRRPIPRHLNVFRLGVLRTQERGAMVRLADDSSPSKISPFLYSNCWVHIHPQEEIKDGAVVDVFIY